MLHRSTSSRRRRASRSVATTPQSHSAVATMAAGPRGRRASVATDKSACLAQATLGLNVDRHRSPRNSVVPDIALDTDDDAPSDEHSNEVSASNAANLIGLLSLTNSAGNEGPTPVGHTTRTHLVASSNANANSRGDIRDNTIDDLKSLSTHTSSPIHFHILSSHQQASASQRITWEVEHPVDSLAPESSVNRSPRNSLVPDDGYCRSPRGSLVPDPGRSPRNSLVPDIGRSPRNSLVPDVSRSPRHSLVPDASALSPRNSLVPDVGYNRSPRNSLVPDSSGARSQQRHSLVPSDAQHSASKNSLTLENGASRSPRHSLVPDSARSPRGSTGNIEFIDRSPRGSICPETAISRSPRGSITPLDVSRSPRGSIASECLGYHSPRGSIAPDPNRSPRGSIAPDVNRSPRGSICPTEGNRSPRGSIGMGHDPNRSPRGSIGLPEIDRCQRGSIGGVNEEDARSHGNGIGPDFADRSPRGSLSGVQENRRSPRSSLAFQDRRRASADQETAKNRSGSPYRQREVNSGSVRSGGSGGAQVNLGYGTNAWADSRRASSSVSQFSGDESRRLCGGGVSLTEKGTSGVGPLGVATYGSLAFQLKDAHLEASGTCDFVLRALRVMSKTLAVTIFMAFLSTMPLLMLIMGLQFIKDCPREPYIPVYMVVGGTLGGVRMFWALYSQIRSRRPEVLSVPGARPHVSPTRLAAIALSCFLAGWFVLGNYWILRIRWPDYYPTLFEPNHWCHKTLYIFSLVHLCVVYAALAVSFLVALGLAFCRILACPWPERYK